MPDTERDKHQPWPQPHTSPVAPLIVPVEWQTRCENCNGNTRHLAEFQTLTGLIATCQRCGARKIAPWTRTPQQLTFYR